MIAQLQDERFENLAQISELNDELTKLNSQLEHVKEHAGIMTAGTDESTRSKPMLEHSKEHQYSKTKKKPNSWVCDHCNGKGHIRPYCFKLHGESKQYQQKPYKRRWIHRNINTGFIAHTFLRASSKEDWYFDSGCSKHMTGVDKYLEDVRPYTSSYVRFGLILHKQYGSNVASTINKHRIPTILIEVYTRLNAKEKRGMRHASLRYSRLHELPQACKSTLILEMERRSTKRPLGG